MLYEKLHNNLKSPTDRNSALSPMCKLLLALRYYALGSMFIAIGDFAGVCKTSAWKAVREVTLALASLCQEVIKFPTTAEEIQRAQIQFYQISRFPKVVGALDCTHVEIQSPAQEILYNEAHIRTRNTVERSYGVWKRRFAILSQCLHLRPENVQDIVVATAVLHNIAIDANEPEPPEIPGIVVRDAVNIYVEANPGGRNDGTRRAIIDGYFSRLLDEHR